MWYSMYQCLYRTIFEVLMTFNINTVLYGIVLEINKI